jgi:FMN phosphatase YigB (HAD superfamily)
MFETRFLSFEIGFLKPDRQAFDHVARHWTGRLTGCCFSMTTSPMSIGAFAAGFSAVRVSGVPEARLALVAAGAQAGPGPPAPDPPEHRF